MAKRRTSKTDGQKTQQLFELPLEVVIPVKPIAASRPRIPRYGKPYFAKTYKRWRDDSATAVGVYAGTPIQCPTRATVLFAIPRAKSSKLIVPSGDGDNFEKALYDFLQRQRFVADDKWITSAFWAKRFLPHGQVGYTKVTLEEEPDELDIEE